jgi:methyl coenzyme M reductase gamma subunit
VYVEFNEYEVNHESTLSIEMEKVHIASETEDERVGRDANLGVKGSNSNGHGKEMDKEGHMMKLIERL